MTMKKHGNLVFSDGEYQNAQGETKKRWEKFGVVMKDDQKGTMSIYIPLFGKWFSVFEDKQKSQQAPSEQTYTQPGTSTTQGNQMPPAPEDDLPF